MAGYTAGGGGGSGGNGQMGKLEVDSGEGKDRGCCGKCVIM